MVDILWLGLVLLAAPVLGNYAKMVKDKRGFVWLTGAGILYLLAAAFTVEISWVPATLSSMGTLVFSLIALIATFIGSLMVAASVFK